MFHLKFLLPVMVVLTIALSCADNTPASSGSSGSSSGSASSSSSGENTAITISGITGVTPPSYAGTPVTTITETAQYTGSVTWSPSSSTFAATTVYTATINLTAKSGYTLTGVGKNFFTVSGATATNQTNSGVVTAVFPATGAAPATVVNIAAIPGVTAPVLGETPVAAITETAQYTGSVTWSPSDSKFAATTIYTATINLTAKSGYTLTGVGENFFTVSGATATNQTNSGVVTAVFPATASPVNVAFQSAVQTGGTSGTADSTALTLTFDVDPATLKASDITVTGATKGGLSGSGTTRSLAISDITAANGSNVSVTITSPLGYVISGSPKTAVVYRLLSIGMAYQGGIIAYILQSGDPGYDAGVPHGLIAATADLGTGIQWWNGSYIRTGATGQALGTGRANTTAIVNIQGAGSYAAKLCDDYVNADKGTGVFSDWYLPSKDELNKLYLLKGEFGGFPGIIYWSSSEDSVNYALVHYFIINHQASELKSSTYTSFTARPVRSF